MKIHGTVAAIAVACVLITGCGGGGSGSPTTPTSPTPPTTPTPPANRAPVISGATVNPAWGVSTLTTHSFTSAATDPDGDAVSYAWDFGNGTASTSPSAAVTFNNANTTTYQAKVTVTDSRGAAASSTVTVVSTAITGTWNGTVIGIPITTSMTQYLGGVVLGSYSIPMAGIAGEIGPSGAPGRIQANGQFELRFKARTGGSYTDFFYRGTMDPTGRRLTGTLQGSGFTGEFLELFKQ